MPYHYGEGDPGWDELGDEAPRATSFRYLPPPDFGGSPEPTRFSDVPPAPRAATPDPVAPPQTFWDRLLGRRRFPPLRPWEERQEEEKHRCLHAIALATAALRQIEVSRLYGRYDGGNDEGFAWLDHAVARSGGRLSVDDLAARLADTDLLERLAAEKLAFIREDITDRVEIVRSVISDGFAVDCAVLLLGSGFGTGPYWLYGAFTVDLDACTITDDRNAEPIAENIQLQR